MRLEELMQNIEIKDCIGELDIDIEKICFDSSQVQQNSLFICLKGKNCDGQIYADLAIAKGAIAVICSQDYANKNATIIKVEDTRKTLSLLAINFYKNPAKNLKIISIVGTNGKSTTAYIISKLLKNGGYNVGLIGTISYEYNDKILASSLTTPDPLDMQKLLREMVDGGVQVVVMEVSAHAIYLKKLYGIISDVSIFTNLSQDHLDFFGNMQDYKKCKMSYFDKQNTKLAIVNIDDDCGREIVDLANLPTITYGLVSPCDCFAIDIDFSMQGSTYIANVCDEIINIKTNLMGEFNVYNSLAAFVVARLFDISEKSISTTMREILPPNGRFNAINCNGICYVVDFAHTPDGLYNLLKESKKICKGRLITVFGCGGDRDVSKRALMGKIASEMSDIVIVTTDNPRTESRKAIANDILTGIRLKGKLYVELDRAKAVQLGVELAVKNDIVIIAGKGSEDYIDENNQKTPYNDMGELVKCMERVL